MSSSLLGFFGLGNRARSKREEEMLRAQVNQDSQPSTLTIVGNDHDHHQHHLDDPGLQKYGSTNNHLYQQTNAPVVATFPNRHKNNTSIDASESARLQSWIFPRKHHSSATTSFCKHKPPQTDHGGFQLEQSSISPVKFIGTDAKLRPATTKSDQGTSSAHQAAKLPDGSTVQTQNFKSKKSKRLTLFNNSNNASKKNNHGIHRTTAATTCATAPFAESCDSLARPAQYNHCSHSHFKKSDYFSSNFQSHSSQTQKSHSQPHDSHHYCSGSLLQPFSSSHSPPLTKTAALVPAPAPVRVSLSQSSPSPTAFPPFASYSHPSQSPTPFPFFPAGHGLTSCSNNHHPGRGSRSDSFPDCCPRHSLSPPSSPLPHRQSLSSDWFPASIHPPIHHQYNTDVSLRRVVIAHDPSAPSPLQTLQQVPSRKKPSVIPTDINEPHPFGVWLSHREAPTSLPPPPRSPSASLSHRRTQSNFKRGPSSISHLTKPANIVAISPSTQSFCPPPSQQPSVQQNSASHFSHSSSHSHNSSSTTTSSVSVWPHHLLTRKNEYIPASASSSSAQSHTVPSASLSPSGSNQLVVSTPTTSISQHHPLNPSNKLSDSFVSANKHRSISSIAEIPFSHQQPHILSPHIELPSSPSTSGSAFEPRSRSGSGGGFRFSRTPTSPNNASVKSRSSASNRFATSIGSVFRSQTVKRQETGQSLTRSSTTILDSTARQSDQRHQQSPSFPFGLLHQQQAQVAINRHKKAVKSFSLPSSFKLLISRRRGKSLSSDKAPSLSPQADRVKASVPYPTEQLASPQSFSLSGDPEAIRPKSRLSANPVLFAKVDAQSATLPLANLGSNDGCTAGIFSLPDVEATSCTIRDRVNPSSASQPPSTIKRKTGELLGAVLKERFSPFAAPENNSTASKSQQQPQTLSEDDPASHCPRVPFTENFVSQREMKESRKDFPTSSSSPGEGLPVSSSSNSVRQRSDSRLSTPSSTVSQARSKPVRTTLQPTSFEIVSLSGGSGSNDSQYTLQDYANRSSSKPKDSVPSESAAARLPIMASDEMKMSVSRALGKRAESESVGLKSSRHRNVGSASTFDFPTRDDADGFRTMTAEEREEILQGKSSHSRRSSFIASGLKRLIRRTSLRAKSQSLSAAPWVSPSKSLRSLPVEVEIDNDRQSWRVSEFGENIQSPIRPSQSGNSLGLRNKSRDAGASKHSRTSSIFSTFRSKELLAGPDSTNKKPSRPQGRQSGQRSSNFKDPDESFGNTGALPLDPPEPFPGIPKQSSNPSVQPQKTPFTQSLPSSSRSGDNLMALRDAMSLQSPVAEETGSFSNQPKRSVSMLNANAASLSTNNPDSGSSYKNTEEVDRKDEPSDRDRVEQREMSEGQQTRPVSELTLGTDDGPGGIGLALGGQNALDLTESLAINELSASGGASEPIPSINHYPAAVSPNSRSLHPPRASIPRIWQGIEPAETSDLIDSDQVGDQVEPLLSQSEAALGSSKFDTVTTNSSFKSAQSNPNFTSSSQASNPNRLDLRSIGFRNPPEEQHSPRNSSLSGVVEVTENRSSGPSTADTFTFPRYQDVDSGSNEGPRLKRDRASAVTEQTSLDSLSSSVADPTHSIRPLSGRTMSDAVKLDTKSESISNFVSQQQLKSNSGCISQLTAVQESQMRGTLPIVSQTTPDKKGQEPSRRELTVSEIENYLAAIEAALQSSSSRRPSMDLALLLANSRVPTSSKQANLSGASLLAQDGSHIDRNNEENDVDISMPGAWLSGRPGLDIQAEAQPDLNCLSIDPKSHDAIADAIKSVRCAISSSQLRARGDGNHDDGAATECEANESRDQLGDLAAEISMRSEVTPVRAAKRRQESMRDIEESYSRMLALVQSTAIGITPSPQTKDMTPHRRSRRSRLSLAMQEAQQESPLARSVAQAIGRRERTHSTPAVVIELDETDDGSFSPMRSQEPLRMLNPQIPAHKRFGSIGAKMPQSDSLSGLMGLPPSSVLHLRGRTSNSSMSSTRRAASESPNRGPRQENPRPLKVERSRYSSGIKAAESSRLNQTLTQPTKGRLPTSVSNSDTLSKKPSLEQTEGRAGSGAGTTSPSATAKTLGTPRLQPAEQLLGSLAESNTWGEIRSSISGVNLARPNEPWVYEATEPREQNIHQTDRASRLEEAADAPVAMASTRSPTVNSLLSNSDDYQKRTVAQQTVPSSASSIRLAPAPAPLSPSSSTVGRMRGRYETSSIRDWSSQVSHRPTSRSGAIIHSQLELFHRQHREDVGGSNIQGPNDVDTLIVVGGIPPSSSQFSISSLVRRHELERESLLDSLERTRAELVDLHARHESLTADLHAEVTRVLEQERELDRRDDRELRLHSRTKQLENELAEVKLENQTLLAKLAERESVDRTITGSSNGSREGSRSGSSVLIDSDSAFNSDQSKRGESLAGYSSQSQSKSSERTAFAAKPGHRSILSESILPSQSLIQKSLAPSSSNATIDRFAAHRELTEQPRRARPVSLVNGPTGLVRPSQSSSKDKLAGDAANLKQPVEHGNLYTNSDAKKDRDSPTLRNFDALLGLNLDEDEMDWALVNEQPPEDTSRDSFEESPMDLSSFLASYTDSSRMTEPKEESGDAAAVAVAEPPSQSAKKISLGRATSAASISTSQSTTESNRNKMTGSLGIAFNPTFLTRPAGASFNPQSPPSRRRISSSSSARSTSSRINQLSSIPVPLSNRNISSRSTLTQASSYTARSDSPVGSFVTNWRTRDGVPESPKPSNSGAEGSRFTHDSMRSAKSSPFGVASKIGGYYDPRRPGDYDPHSLPPSHEAMLDVSFGSVEDEVQTTTYPTREPFSPPTREKRKA